MYDWSLWCDRSRHNHFIVSVVVERMYDWSRTRQRLSLLWIAVSVVVERMYDWSFLLNVVSPLPLSFSCCWKDVRLKHDMSQSITIGGPSFSCCWKDVRLKLDFLKNDRILRPVSVVVERMYDWSFIEGTTTLSEVFQLLLKGCTIEAIPTYPSNFSSIGFSCCWKDVRLKLTLQFVLSIRITFQLLLKGCTIEAKYWTVKVGRCDCFSCCWKDVRLKLRQRNKRDLEQ